MGTSGRAFGPESEENREVPSFVWEGGREGPLRGEGSGRQ